MNTKYYKISIDEAKTFLNSLSDDALDTLCDEYNITDSDVKDYTNKADVLAEIVSDDDLVKLGYDIKEEPISEEIVSVSTPEYKYSNVDDIIRFLATEIDEYEIEQLYQRYGCNSLADLAVALTDNELFCLGYGRDDEASKSQPYENPFDSLTPYNEDYNESLDYLEDIPNNIPYYMIDADNGILATDNEEDYCRFRDALNPALVNNCEPYPDVVDAGNKYLFSIEPTQFPIQEEVVIDDTLNKSIFDADNHVLPEVRELLLGYAMGFIKQMNERGVNLDYSDICLVGSNAGYLYTPESDIDIHIISNNPIQPEVAEALFNEFDLYEAENPLIIGNAKVELGLEDGYDITIANTQSRRYSLVNDSWVGGSDALEQYKPEDINKVSGYEEIVNAYTQRINELIDNDEYAQAVALKQEIRQNRSEDLAQFGALSMGNIVFKELRNNGAYGKLREYIAKKDMGDLFNE